MVEELHIKPSSPAPSLPPSIGWRWLFPIHGWIHRRLLMPLSRWYCRLKKIQHDPAIFPLPFGLILKSTHKTRIDEAIAMTLAYRSGIPTSRLISYGSGGPQYFTSTILMTRVPGRGLDEVYKTLSPDELQQIKAEVAKCIAKMKTLHSPYGAQVCSVTNGAVLGHDIICGAWGPCVDERAFNDAYLLFAQDTSRASRFSGGQAGLDKVAQTARQMYAMPHEIRFAHGDLLPHNILILDGHFSGIIDWEYAGWLPEYWDYTAMLRWPSKDYWWNVLMLSLPDSLSYPREREYFKAMWHLAEESFSW